MVQEKFFFNKLEILQRMHGSLTFDTTQQFQVLDSCYFLQLLPTKELKIAQIDEVNQLLQQLNLVVLYVHESYANEENIYNDISKDSLVNSKCSPLYVK